MSDTDNLSKPPSRRRIPVYVQSLLFLLFGLIIGSGLTIVVIRGAVHRMIAEPDLLPARVLQRLDSQLALDDAQRAAIDGIFSKRLAAFRDIRERVRPEIQAEIDGLRNDVSAVLNPDQRAKWEQRFDTLRARWQPGDLAR